MDIAEEKWEREQEILQRSSARMRPRDPPAVRVHRYQTAVRSINKMPWAYLGLARCGSGSRSERTSESMGTGFVVGMS